jgi:hypothetical protein
MSGLRFFPVIAVFPDVSGPQFAGIRQKVEARSGDGSPNPAERAFQSVNPDPNHTMVLVCHGPSLARKSRPSCRGEDPEGPTNPLCWQ